MFNSKKKKAIIIALVLLFPFIAGAQSLTKYVNPFVGTGAHGHTFPGAMVPFGAVQLSPDTRLTGWDGCGIYHYDDHIVYGFSHTHISGTGVPDYGDILIMPFTGQGSTNKKNYCSPFTHQSEVAQPGYYAVTLDKSGIRAELTATSHVGCHRYTFPETKGPKGIVVDLVHRDFVIHNHMETINDHEFSGYRISRAWCDDQHACFYMSLSQPVKEIQYYLDTVQMRTNVSLDGTTVKAILLFDEDVREVVIYVGLSAVDQAGARANLAEVARSKVSSVGADFVVPTPTSADFDRIRKYSDALWNHELRKFEVSGSEVNKRIFYTSLYHCFLSPFEFSDFDGRYRGHDGKIHNGDGHKVYTVFSLWDTYRALHPLMNLIDRNRTNDFLNTFLLVYHQGGQLPMWELSAYETWCMIGYHSVPVILDAARKGIGDFDKKEMLKAMVGSAELPKFGRPEFEQYQYIPADKEHESVSKTLEYCFDDWCIAQFAHDIGDKATYNRFINRSQFYKNIVDANGFAHPRSNGGFIMPFSPGEANDHFTEANSWQYFSYIPHDFTTYTKLVGGKEHVSVMLDSLFFGQTQLSGYVDADITGIMGQYAHGNEPGHHAPYMFNYVGQPWKTQQVVRRILAEQYFDAPDGVCGNEDCGQMSAWYILSSIGFYAVAPGSNLYDIGSPIFDEVKMHLENGNTFTVICKNQSPKNIYIQSVKRNGQPYKSTQITYQMISDGDTFEFEMGATPNHSAFTTASVSEVEETVIPSPIFEPNDLLFADQMTINLKQVQPVGTIYYSTSADGFRKVNTYRDPLTIKETTTIRAWVESGDKKSVVEEATFKKFVKDKKIKYITRYNPYYTAGGDEGLIDGLRGNPKWKLGGWQGFEAQDLEVIIDLQATKGIHKVSVGFLEDIPNWIIFPKKVIVEVSDDGEKFVHFGEFTNPHPDNDVTVKIEDFTVKGSSKARYVKIKAVNYGKLPAWHSAAGAGAFIFADEVTIE